MQVQSKNQYMVLYNTIKHNILRYNQQILIK